MYRGKCGEHEIGAHGEVVGELVWEHDEQVEEERVEQGHHKTQPAHLHGGLAPERPRPETSGAGFF